MAVNKTIRDYMASLGSKSWQKRKKKVDMKALGKAGALKRWKNHKKAK